MWAALCLDSKWVTQLLTNFHPVILSIKQLLASLQRLLPRVVISLNATTLSNYKLNCAYWSKTLVIYQIFLSSQIQGWSAAAYGSSFVSPDVNTLFSHHSSDNNWYVKYYSVWHKTPTKSVIKLSYQVNSKCYLLHCFTQLRVHMNMCEYWSNTSSTKRPGWLSKLA